MNNIMKYFLFICLLLVCTGVFGQQKPGTATPDAKATIDSLLEQLIASKTDTAKIAIYNALANQYNRNNNADEALKYGKTALELAEKAEWKKGMADACLHLGHIYLAKLDYSNSFAVYDRGLKLYEQINNQSGVTKIYIGIGELYFRMGKYSESLQYSFKGLKLAEKEGRNDNLAVCMMNIGEIFKLHKDYNKSLDYYNRGLAIYKEIGNKQRMIVALCNIGNIYYTTSNIEKAATYYKSALNIATEIGDKKSTAENLTNLSNVYSEQNVNDTALEYAFKALGIYTEMNDQKGCARIMGNIGTTYLLIASDPGAAQKVAALRHESNRAIIEKAISYLQKAISIDQQLGEINNLQQFYENVSEAYSMIGNYKDAFESQKQFVIYKDSILDKQKTKEIVGLELEFEFSKQRDSIRFQKLLSEERLSSEQKSRRQDQFYFVAGIIVLLLVAVFIFRSLRTQQTLNATITKLVNEQEKTIEQRTSDLSISNRKLRELISFNAHQIREPLTRITGSIQIREYVEMQEYFDDFLPLMEKAAIDLDNAIKNVLEKAQDNTDPPLT